MLEVIVYTVTFLTAIGIVVAVDGRRRLRKARRQFREDAANITRVRARAVKDAANLNRIRNLRNDEVDQIIRDGEARR